jgi:hypothetical protein
MMVGSHDLKDISRASSFIAAIDRLDMNALEKSADSNIVLSPCILPDAFLSSRRAKTIPREF